MSKRVKVLMIAEIDIAPSGGAMEVEIARKLDGFREATLPSENFGITLYQATQEDLTTDHLPIRWK